MEECIGHCSKCGAALVFDMDKKPQPRYMQVRHPGGNRSWGNIKPTMVPVCPTCTTLLLKEVGYFYAQVKDHEALAYALNQIEKDYNLIIRTMGDWENGYTENYEGSVKDRSGSEAARKINEIMKFVLEDNE